MFYINPKQISMFCRVVFSIRYEKFLKQKQEGVTPPPVKPIKRIIVSEKPEDHKEMENLLGKVDELLAKLPEEEIQNFVQSPHFEIYKKIMGKYKVH